MYMASKASVQEIVVARLIEKIEQEGRLPWQKPFQGASMNWFSKHEYTGINKILLGSGEYVTTKQIEQTNEKTGKKFWFEKGTPSEIVVFYSQIKKKITPDEASKIIAAGGARTVFPTDEGWVKITWFLRYYRVYNIKYIRNLTNPKIRESEEYKDGIFEKKEREGRNNKTLYSLVTKGGLPVLKEGITQDDYEVLESKLGTEVIEEHTPSEEIIEKYRDGTGVNLTHDMGEGAYYTEYNDTVNMPNRNSHISTEAYCRVLFHEFVHSTGIEKRLKRSCFKKYHAAKAERSKEELVAEIGGLLLASEAGFRGDTELAQNSENYVANWCKWMKDNPSEVVSGFFAAERAKNYILSGGVIANASSTRNIDNPTEKQEDGDFDGEEENDAPESTSAEKPESKVPPTTSTNNDEFEEANNQPKVRTIKTIKGVKEYYLTFLKPYFDTEDEAEKASILKTVTGDDLRYIYKKVTKEDMAKSVKRKADAIALLQEVIK